MHLGTDGAQFKEGEHILRNQADATVGNRCADFINLIGAMYVDIARARVGIVRFQPLKRENTAQNGVATLCGLRIQAHGFAATEYRMERGIQAVARIHSKQAGGRFTASLLTTYAGCTR